MAFGWLADAVGIAGNVVGIARNLRDPEAPESLGYMQQAARRSREIADALAQPDLGKFSGLVDAEQDEIVRGAARDIYDLANADRESRIRSASGKGMFDSDRRDETITREFIRQRDASRDAARIKARSYLTGALEANNIALGGFAAATGLETGLNDQKFGRQSRAFEQIGTLAGSEAIGGLLDKLKTNTSGGMQLLNGSNGPQFSGFSSTPTFDVRTS